MGKACHQAGGGAGTRPIVDEYSALYESGIDHDHERASVIQEAAS
jgi:hypothetical protein